jgi:hypothetical protein
MSKVICKYSAICAIPDRDCIHKREHEKMEFACGTIYCVRSKRKASCVETKNWNSEISRNKEIEGKMKCSTDQKIKVYRDITNRLLLIATKVDNKGKSPRYQITQVCRLKGEKIKCADMSISRDISYPSLYCQTWK